MRKTKTARHSRIIRKWDGTPIADAPETQHGPVETVTPAMPTAPRREELIFEFDHEGELSDSLDVER